MAVVKNLMVRAGADFSGLKKETDKAKKTLTDFKTSTASIMKGIKTALIAGAVGKAIKDSVASAMGVETSMQQIGRIMGNSAQEFMKWANTQSTAFNMSKADALKYGAIYGNLISGFSKDTTEALNNTQELLKASAIVASATGRSMEDTMDRIRSGLLGNTESIEDLGINVNIAMIESTEAFRKFAGDKSWQQLDFNTQQQIRLAAILEQTYKKYGDTVSQNTASSVAQLVAQLKNLQLALGQAFLPIVNLVLPILTKFVGYLVTVTNVVAQFMQAIFGKSATKQAQTQTKATAQQTGAVNKLGNAYKGAGSKAKGFLASFDEINALSKANSGGGSGGAGGGIAPEVLGAQNGMGQIGSITQEVSAKVQEFANKIKEVVGNVKSFFITGISDMWGAVKGIWDTYGQTLINNLIDFGNSIKSIVSNVWQSYINPIMSAGLEFLTKIWNNHLKGVLLELGEFVMKLANGALEIWNKFITPIVNWFIEKFGPVIASVLSNSLKTFGNFLGLILDVSKGLIKALGGVIDFITGVFTGNWAKAWGGIKDIFKGVFDSLYSIVKTPLNYIIDSINSVIKGLNRIKLDIPGWSPFGAGKSFGINIPQIPRLAQGGITNGPMVSVIGDNPGGREVVSPLDDLKTMIAEVMRANNSNDNREVVIMLDEIELGRASIRAVNRAQRVAGKPLIIT